ncbi:uncharacterized protein [Leptinotarsa decemlineata]|uniref:uncharacterized protein n=1 Tax=Leptinotarsa decemlineata TaxID=7539 RepID=UPI003D30CB7C
MVRRKVERKIGATSKEAMARAVRLILDENHSLRQAGEICGIKFQTLARYVKRAKNKPGENVRMEPNYANRQVFSEEDERMLAEYIITCSQMAYGLTTEGVKKLAYQFAIANNRRIPESWKANKIAGCEWLRSFRKRRGNLSIRQPEQCSLSRLTSFNEFNVKTFYSNLRSILEKNEKLKNPSRIYNLDETSTATVQKPKKVVAAKGVKQISHCTSGERGVLVTTCAIISASGNHIPPAMVYPRKNYKKRMILGAPPGTLGLANPSGWMTVELFVQVLEHFIEHSGSSKENPSLLIYDNHKSHISVEVVNLARNNGVSILTLPPHSSNKMQPLDLAVFGPFKAYYYSAIDIIGFFETLVYQSLFMK